jgi:VWFA-related protein
MLALATPLAAQPIIRVTTRLVQIDVVAHDRHGAVADLTKENFTIFDRGQPQPVAVFEKRLAESSPTPTASAPGVFTNDSGSPNAAVASSTVVLLDGLNSPVMDQYQAKEDVLKFVRGVRPGERVAIFSLWGGIQVEQNFTANAKLLADAVDRGRWGAGMLWQQEKQQAEAAAQRANAAVNAELARLVANIRAGFVSSNSGGKSDRVRATCIALSALARYLGATPGRKNILWVTGGIPLTEWADEPKLYTDEISQADDALNDAHVSVYPIDLTGLMPINVLQPPGPHSPKPSRGASLALPMGGKGSPATGHTGPNEGMFHYVAHATGGKPFINQNGVLAPMRDAAADVAVTYILGFYANAETLDSRRHAIRVEVNRSAVDLRYRQGYTATPDDPATRIPTRAEVESALWTTVDSAGISMAATRDRLDDGMVRLNLRVPARDIDFEKGENLWSGVLALIYDQRAADDRDLGRISETLNIRYDDDHFAALPPDGIAYTKLVRPSPDAAKIRILVYDRRSGRLGSITLPLAP